MNKVVIIGSSSMDYTIYVDKFPLSGETVFAKSRFVQPGGKGANQAVAVANSKQVETHFIVSLGNDNEAKQIKNILLEHEIIPHIKECECETGNATIFVNNNSENEIAIVAGANALLNKEDIDVNLIKNAKYVILQNEIPSSTNEFVIKTANQLGVKVIYNPAPYREIDSKLLKFIDTFIVNEIELEQYSREKDIEKGVAKLLSLGIKNVLVTLGEKGSVYLNKTERYQINAYKVKAIDTVAAGDTYVGYFTSSLASGYSVKEAMDFANKASALTVLKKGSMISIPFGNDVY